MDNLRFNCATSNKPISQALTMAGNKTQYEYRKFSFRQNITNRSAWCVICRNFVSTHHSRDHIQATNLKLYLQWQAIANKLKNELNNI